MRKSILALMLVMSMAASQASLASSAPRHRHHAATEQVDKSGKKSAAEKKQKDDEEALEAYSDTTSVDTAAVDSDDAHAGASYHSQFSLGNYDDPFDFLGSVFGKGMLIFFIILFCLIGLLFVFAPLIIIWVIVRYLMKRHNDRMKLAEMAMEKGINVPESQRPMSRQSNEYLMKRGIRNAFLGIGLCVMFAFWDASFLVGIGALVAFYGVGQVVIGSLPAIKEWWNNRQGNDDGPGFTGTAI